jgi:hypothetical protein
MGASVSLSRNGGAVDAAHRDHKFGYQRLILPSRRVANRPFVVLVG